MSPEQIGGKDYGENVDLWSVGAILYEMVTGRKVFDVTTKKELVAAAQKNPHIMLSSTVDKDTNCRNLLEGLLKKEPSERMTYEAFFAHPFLMPDLPSTRNGGGSSGCGERNENLPNSSLLLSDSKNETKMASNEEKTFENNVGSKHKFSETGEKLEDSWELLTAGDFIGDDKNNAPERSLSPSTTKSTKLKSIVSTNDSTPSLSVSYTGKEKQDTINEEKKEDNTTEKGVEVIVDDAVLDKVVENEVAKNEAAETEAVEKEAAENEAVENEAVENEAVENEAVENEAVENEAVENEVDSSASNSTYEETKEIAPTKSKEVLEAPVAAIKVTPQPVQSKESLQTNKISINAKCQIGQTALFFLVHDRDNHMFYKRYQYGNSSHQYLDDASLDAIKRKRRRQQNETKEVKQEGETIQTEKSLPKYFIASVIMLDEQKASNGNNPYQLPDDTKFTNITATDTITNNGSNIDEDSIKISYLSFKVDDIVLGLPMNPTKDGGIIHYHAFNEIDDGVVYMFTEESVAAFQRMEKGKDKRRGDLVGRILMMNGPVIENSRQVCKLTVAPLLQKVKNQKARKSTKRTVQEGGTHDTYY
jgi:hypothetical protein